MTHAGHRPRLILVSLLLLAAAMAPRLLAQRIEIAGRAGYLAPTGTQFRLTSTNPGLQLVRPVVERRRTLGGRDCVVLAEHARRGAGHRRLPVRAAPRDLRLFLHDPRAHPRHASDAGGRECDAAGRLVPIGAVGRDWDVEPEAGAGPAMIRFSDSEYRPAPTPGAGFPGPYFLAHRATYGVAVGLSAAYTVSSRFRLSVSADDVLYRAWPADASSWGAVAVPMQHELTFSAAAAVTVP